MQQERVALLLIHGIGEHRPGEFLRRFEDGFRQLFGDERVTPFRRQDPVHPEREVHGARMELNERTIYLYEVHWADLIDDELARGSFNPEHLFPLAWFPWFNKRAGLPGFDSYRPAWVAWWTVRLLSMSILFFLGYLGIRAIPHLFWAWDSAIAMVDKWDQARPKSGATVRRTRARGLRERKIPQRRKHPLLELMRLEQRGWFDALLDKYAGDVVNCVVSMARLPGLRGDIATAQSSLRELIGQSQDPKTIANLEQRLSEETRRRDALIGLADRLYARFNAVAWLAATEDRCIELQVLGHSLGTVIAYQAMNQLDAPETTASETDDGAPRLAASLTRFHTVGSPLEKFHFFWPCLVAPRRACPLILAQGDGQSMHIPAGPNFKWTNYYSVSDKVSGALLRYGAWGGVTNELMPGLGGVFTAHVAYGGNLQFLRALAASLGVQTEAVPDSSMTRAAGWLWSLLQAMVFPLSIFLVCALGAAVLLGIAALAPAMLAGLLWSIAYLINLLQPDWLNDWSPHGTFYWLTAFFSLAVAIGFSLFVPLWGRRVARIAVSRQWRRLCPATGTTNRNSRGQIP